MTPLPGRSRWLHKASGEVWRVLQPVTPGGGGKSTLIREGERSTIRSLWPADVRDETRWQQLESK